MLQLSSWVVHCTASFVCDTAQGSAGRQHLVCKFGQLVFEAPPGVLHNQLVRDVHLHSSSNCKGNSPLIELVCLSSMPCSQHNPPAS